MVAAGEGLPFAAASFDAISHCDVLCCLAPKLAVLAACRGVIRVDAVMVFTVISIAPGLCAADQARAIASGPPFIATDLDYPTMLHCAGWQIAQQLDLTAEYAAVIRRQEEENHAADLASWFGELEFAEQLDRRRAAAKAAEAGLLCRALFEAIPAMTS